MLRLTKYLLIVAVLSGCSSPSLEENIFNAQSLIQSKKYSEAQIILRQILTENPQNNEARSLFVRSLIETGDLFKAETESERLLKDDFTLERFEELVSIRYTINTFDKIVIMFEEYDGQLEQLTPSTQALFHKYISVSATEGQGKNLDSVLTQLNSIAVDDEYVYLVELYEAFRSSNFENQQSILEKLKPYRDINPNVALALGQVAERERDYKLAVDEYKKAVDLSPYNLRFNALLANAYVRNGEHEKAKSFVNVVLEANTNNPLANLLKGITLFRENKYDDAKLHLEKAVFANYRTDEAKMYAGLSAYFTENYEQAYEYLSDIEHLMSEQDEILKLISSIKMRLGYFEQAAETLSNVEDIGSGDVVLYNDLSSALSSQGNTKLAKSILDKTDTIEIEDAETLTRLGALKLDLEDTSGIKDLQKALELNINQDSARWVLASSYVRSKNISAAMDIAEDWIAAQPDNVEGYNLAAFVSQQSGDMKSVGSYLEKALEIDDTNPASIMYTAAKQREAGDREAAIDTLEKLVLKSPPYLRAVSDYISLSKEAGNGSEALEVIKQTVNANEENDALRSFYTRALFSEKKYQDVLAELRTNKDLKSTNTNLYYALTTRSLEALRNNEQAQKAAEEWVSLQPQNINAWDALFRIDGLQDPKSAEALIKRAKRAIPNAPIFDLMHLESLIQGQKITEAQTLIEQVRPRFDGTPGFIYYEGKVALLSENFTLAKEKFDQVYSAESPQIESHILMAETESKLGNKSKAAEIISYQLDKSPNDNRLKFVLANYLKQTQPSRSEALYTEILETNPDSIAVKNNLAGLYLSIDETEKAAELVNGILEQYPTFAPSLGTMSSIKEAQGNLFEAIAYQEQALKSDPTFENTERLIRLLVKSNRKKQANDVISSNTFLTNAQLQKLRELI